MFRVDSDLISAVGELVEVAGVVAAGTTAIDSGGLESEDDEFIVLPLQLPWLLLLLSSPGIVHWLTMEADRRLALEERQKKV